MSREHLVWPVCRDARVAGMGGGGGCLGGGGGGGCGGGGGSGGGKACAVGDCGGGGGGGGGGGKACAVGNCGANDGKPCGHHGQENRGTLIAEHSPTDMKEQIHCQSEIGTEHTKQGLHKCKSLPGGWRDTDGVSTRNKSGSARYERRGHIQNTHKRKTKIQNAVIRREER
jgi:hypothetical protein